ncbi:fibronectin type III domain-containing protein [Bacillus sp. CGMCC 1.60114]|uniref:fibronectin type III domain-containing protein n=1 Tax=unclassified Bacillus (in: firmicutes) TaxID=185979 RepID=UPI0036356120
MKKIISRCLLTTACVIGFSQTPAFAAEKNEVPKLQIPVMSDTHISGANQADNFAKALQEYKELAPNYKALAVVGDLTDQGLDSQYDEFNRILNMNMNPNAEKVLSIGNHELFEMRFWPKPWITNKTLTDRFVNKTGMPGVYYDKWIEGYHFISLGGEEMNENDYAIISDAQYSWLEKTLPVQADPKKPIFVFLHQPIDDTVYGSDEWGGGLRDGRLANLLKKYPQVILFSGHLHYMADHAKTAYQDGFTMVNTSAIAYTVYEGGYGPDKSSQGLLVNVYDDKVEIKAREFSNHTWVNSYTIKVPYEKTIDDTEKPSFQSNANIKVENIVGDEMTISWDPAIDNTQIDKYYIKQDGKKIQTTYVKFWDKNAKNNRVSATIPNIKPNTNYQFEIVAVDAWGNESSNSLTIQGTATKQAGWIQRDGKWYYLDEVTGEKKTGWVQSDGKWYYLDKDGVMQTGWVEQTWKWYYFGQDGAMQTGWIQSNGKWYYATDTGMMQTGWLNLNGKWYYLAENGAMQTGVLSYGSSKYYLDKDGVMQTGWVKEGNMRYYLDSNGIMQTGWMQDGNTKYYLDSSGVAKTGWLLLENKWYYLDSNGAVQTGWLQSGNTWYYLDKDGAMKTGWLQSGNTWYYLDKDGAMKTGWLQSGNTWYYLDSNGAMKTGWLQSGNSWYYLDSNGVMQTGWLEINGKYYYFDHTGVWRP